MLQNSQAEMFAQFRKIIQTQQQVADRLFLESEANQIQLEDGFLNSGSWAILTRQIRKEVIGAREEHTRWLQDNPLRLSN